MKMPRVDEFDSTASFFADPYRFIGKNTSMLQSPVFEARIFLKKTVFMKGEEAASIFYGSTHFTRKGAAPEPLRETLLGQNSIQNYDGKEHLDRKALFMSLMGPESIDHLKDLTLNFLETHVERWQSQEKVSLYPEFQEILTKAVCEWAGIHLVDGEVKQRTHDLTFMFDKAGAKDIGHFQSRLARNRSEKWLSKLIREKRDSAIRAGRNALEKIAFYKDKDGNYHPEKIAAAELLNLLRPTVAVSLYLVFCLHALHLKPEWKERIKNSSDDLENFIREVRRFYPFFPASVAKVKEDFIWNGFEFTKGSRVFLDIYGTNHDEKIYDRPLVFDPDRFKYHVISDYNFIPQGAGTHETSHRCPGEWITIELMKSVTRFFMFNMFYEVPVQDLSIDITRIPAMPASKLIINKVVLNESSEELIRMRSGGLIMDHGKNHKFFH